jgi:subtilase-type serine protease
LTNFGDSRLTNVGTLINNGSMNIAGGVYQAGGLRNVGTLINNAGGTLTNAHGLVNAGMLINAGTLNGTGTYYQTAGQTINNGTLSQLGGVNIQGGLLSGTGTINAPVVTLSNGAILSPGNVTTFGTLTINGNLQSSGNLMFRIGGLGTGQFDVLAIHGMAFLNGGTVGFNFVNFTPVAGNSWDFLYAGAISGWNTLQFNLAGLGPGLTYAFNYSNGVETLTVSSAHSVPEPNSLLLLAFALGGLAFWRWLKRA